MQWQGGEQGAVEGLSSLDREQPNHPLRGKLTEATALSREAEGSWHACQGYARFL